MYGIINFESFPTGANVIIDGMSQNTITPCIIENIPFGDYKFQLSMEGFNTITGHVKVNRNYTIDVYAQLHQYVEGFGGIEIWSVPENATVLINEHVMDITTPIIITQIPPGEYLIEVMKKNHITYSIIIVVEGGMTELINIELQKKSVKDFQQIVKSSMVLVGAMGIINLIKK